MKMMLISSMKRLSQVNPDGINGNGIFNALQNFDVPWKDLQYNAALDMIYYGNKSGHRIISPLVENILSDNEVLESDDLIRLARSAYTIYGNNWARMWAVNKSEYEPIENYNMVENGENNKETNYGKTRTLNNNLIHGKTGKDTMTPQTTITENESIFGFNSTSDAPANKRINEQTGTNTTEYNTTETDTGTQTNNDGGKDTETNTHTLTRHGNIGVTTTQQMLLSEIDLWIWNFFDNVVFPDIDKILTINIY